MNYIPLIFNIFIFIFGVCIGSFLNCVIYRTELKEQIVAGPNKKNIGFWRGRSFCPNCGHILNWQDLFPVFSFLFLKGKCRYCKAKISWQYPIVEISTAMIFLLIFNFSAIGGPALGWQFLTLCFMFYVASSLIMIFVYDLKHYLIPDKVLFPAIIITFVYRFFINLINSNWILNSNFKFQILNYILAVLIASGFFFSLWLFSKGRWMGFGDVKLAILMGLLLGTGKVLTALFLAFFFGAIISIILLMFHGKKLKSEIPFGPFLIMGTFVAFFWGEQIIQWYLNLF